MLPRFRTVKSAVVKILDGADGKRRVLVVKRDDGKFGLRAERRYLNTHDGEIADGWAPLLSPGSAFQTPELAEREARATFWWLS